jgi:hypothetical protein
MRNGRTNFENMVGRNKEQQQNLPEISSVRHKQHKDYTTAKSLPYHPSKHANFGAQKAYICRAIP